jgi:hypothetical protein
MVRRIREIHPFWMDDVFEISYRELVLGESLDLMPWLSEECQRFLLGFEPADPNCIAWVAERRRTREEQINKRLQWQRSKVRPGQFFLERDERTFFRQITNLLLQQLSQPASRADLMETFLRVVFVQRHSENEDGIRAALSKVNESNVNTREFSRNYLIATLVYLVGPITKTIADPNKKQQPLKVLARQKQRKNLEDQEYVTSAFLAGGCSRVTKAWRR